jgi:hypothetical protein
MSNLEHSSPIFHGEDAANMDPKVKARLGGVFLVAIGAWLLVSEWRSALTDGIYHPKASAIAPFSIVLGAMLLIYPITKQEIREKYGSDQLRWAHMNGPQKVLTVLAFVLALCNWLLISGTIRP